MRRVPPLPRTAHSAAADRPRQIEVARSTCDELTLLGEPAEGIDVSCDIHADEIAAARQSKAGTSESCGRIRLVETQELAVKKQAHECLRAI